MNASTHASVDELFIKTFLIAFGSLLFFGLPYQVVAYLDPPALAKYRVQSTPFPRDVFWSSTKWLLINYFISGVVTYCAFPLVFTMLRVDTESAALPGLFEVLWHVGFCVVAEDCLFYLFHRFVFHNGKLYKYVHKWHHEHRQPVAFTGAFMHPLEQQIITLNILLPALFLHVHIYTLWIWLLLRNWQTAEEHCGYDFPWALGRLLPIYQGPSYHDFHHSRSSGNFAAVFPIWDKLFGTFSDGYLRHLSMRNKQAAKSG